MHVWNVLHAARWKYRTQKLRQKSPSAHHHTNLSSYIFANKACIDNRKKIIKRQYLLHMSSQYGKLRPLSGWDRFNLAVWGTPANFNWLRVLASLLHRRCSSEANQTLHDVWPSPPAATLQHIHFRRPLPLTEFCQIQNSLCVQVLPSPILAALLHGTPAAGVSQTFCGVVQGMELRTVCRERHLYIRLGGHHVGHQPTF